MEKLTASTKMIRVSYSDPDATDSSSDEESDKTQKNSKRKVYEIEVEFAEKNKNPRSDSGNFQERMGFKKPNLTSEGKKIVGVRMTESGKFCARIRDPIKKRSVWLGTFATVEAASRAYLAEESKFAELRAKQRAKWVASEKSPFQDPVPSVLDRDTSGLTSFHKGFEKPNPTSEGNKLVGVRMTKSGKFGAAIRDPFETRSVWLGSFATPEEASGAYLAKKSQFAAAKLRAKRRIDCVDPSDLTSSQKGETKRISGVRRRDSGKFSAEIRNPITKRRVWIGTFATEEEASRAYLAKKSQFEDELRAKQGSEKSSAAPDSVPSVLEIETSDLSNDSVGESVGENKVSGNQEAEFGLLFGVQVVDKNGFLVGEFSVLDDLSIC